MRLEPNLLCSAEADSGSEMRQPVRAERHLCSAHACSCGAIGCDGRAAVALAADAGLAAYRPLTPSRAHVAHATYCVIPLDPAGRHAVLRSSAWGDLVEVRIASPDGIEGHSLRRQNPSLELLCSCSVGGCFASELLYRAVDQGFRAFEEQAAAYLLIERDGDTAEFAAPYGMAPRLGPATVRLWLAGDGGATITEVGGPRDGLYQTASQRCSCERAAPCIHRELRARAARRERPDPEIARG